MKETIIPLLSCGLGVVAGRLLINEIGRRRKAEAKAEVLLLHSQTSERNLKEIRKVLNDAHKHILAVSKALRKPAA